MSTGDGRRGRRHLTDDERALWRGITRTLTPLRRAAVEAALEAGELRPLEPETKASTIASLQHARPVAAPKAAAPASPPPLAPIGRRTRARVARGVQPIDARIDLHGLTQGEAHDALLRFLRRAQADGARFVLAITGKGAPGRDSFEERGVLRRQVPHWLRLPEFRAHVVGFETATIGHGGEGALYIQVRRKRG